MYFQHVVAVDDQTTQNGFAQPLCKTSFVLCTLVGAIVALYYPNNTTLLVTFSVLVAAFAILAIVTKEFRNAERQQYGDEDIPDEERGLLDNKAGSTYSTL